MFKYTWIFAGIIGTAISLAQSASAAPEQSPFMVVSNGQAIAEVIIPDNAPRTVTFAAEEFAAYVKKAAGAELKIVPESKWQEKPGLPAVLIGESAAARSLGVTANRLQPGGFRIQRMGNKLILLGRDDSILVWRDKPYEMDPRDRLASQWGTLWAVYEFLERFMGVRWYWPGKLGEIVPELKTIAVLEADITEAPDFEFRRPTGVFADIPREEMLLWWRRMRSGAAGYTAASHSFAQYPEKYGKTHPEYFALQKDGTRLTTALKGGDPCFSNPEMKKIWTRDCVEFLKTHPDFFDVSIMPGDSFERYCCQCPECKAKYEPALGAAGQHSRMIWTYVNDIARAVGQQLPDRYVKCCAYTTFYKYPQGLKLEPNVAVTVCRTDLELYAWDAADIEQSHRDILEWKEHAGMLFTWEYPDLVARSIPVVVYPHGINREYRWLKGKVRGSYIEAPTEAQALDVYVLMKSMWNTDIDVGRIVREYCRDLFGPAAEPMEKFYARMEEIWAKGNHGAKPYNEADNIWGILYNKAVLQEVLNYLDQARRLCPEGSVYAKRMERVDTAFAGLKDKSLKYEKALSVKTRALACARAARPPSMDGIIRPEEWKGASATTDFLEYTIAAAPKVRNTAWAMYDANNLYLAFQAGLIPGQEIKTIAHEHDDGRIANDDSVEVFLTGKDSEGNLHTFQLIVNSRGSLYDGHKVVGPGAQDIPDDLKWESGAQVAVKVGADAWTLVAAIPMQSLALSAAPGKSWKVNFCRNYFFKENDDWQRQFLAWNPTFGGFNNFSRFGTLEFK